MTLLILLKTRSNAREVKTLNAVVSLYAVRIKFCAAALNKEQRAILFDCVPL